ncbi:hypothetical protein B0H14DRAFT_3455540 [Mycena olivaceomarginata]|nr:hypothetical protein B0H14DRAFT_3455540 [Mycena olivaceomarginata]
MSIPLTFADKRLVETVLVGPDGSVHYTTTSTRGFGGRKLTTITAASGLTGFINWREKALVLNGVQRGWDILRSGGKWSKEREWNWGNRPFKLRYNHLHKELIATPTVGDIADTVRFTRYCPHLLHESEQAAIYFPPHMDEVERMFLMAILQTDVPHGHPADGDVQAAASAAAGSAG